MTVIDLVHAEHYKWGLESEGWHLLDRADLSIIKERVPAGDLEHRHYHTTARQFFYILEGEAVIEIEGSRFVLSAGQGIEVRPGDSHQFMNESEGPVVFLVISAPCSRGDRTDL